MRFEAFNYNAALKYWVDSSGNNFHLHPNSIQGSPALVQTVSNQYGSSNSFPAVSGSTMDKLLIGNPMMLNYTLVHVTRYRGSVASERIIQGTTLDWWSGFFSNRVSCSYHNASITQLEACPLKTEDWFLSTDQNSLFRSNGVDKSNTGAIENNGLPSLAVNDGVFPTQVSNWEIAEILIFNASLSTSQVEIVEQQ